MLNILQRFAKPGLNRYWSRRVHRGDFHREALNDALRDAALVWHGVRSVRDWMQGPSLLQPLVYRTAQLFVIFDDCIKAPIVNCIAAYVGLNTGAIGLVYGLAKCSLGGFQDISEISTAAQTGAKIGFQFVHGWYTFNLRLSLFSCSLLAACVGLPTALIHRFVGRTAPFPFEVAASFRPMFFPKVERFLRSLEGQGGALSSICNMQVEPGHAPHTWVFSGDIKAIFGLYPVTKFTGEVTGDGVFAQRMRIRVPGQRGINPIDLDFTPTFLRGRLHMTGTASGFHYSKNKPNSPDLNALGYARVEGVRNDGNQQENALRNQFDQPNRCMRFTRGISAGEITQQLTYNGGWRDGYSMGPVELVRFPFAVAVELGMSLHLDV